VIQHANSQLTQKEKYFKFQTLVTTEVCQLQVLRHVFHRSVTQQNNKCPRETKKQQCYTCYMEQTKTF